ncbi:MAG TPA: DUF1684 domain-containing protein [Candidatus Nanopelagicaceae bacterium]|nr:DUF1684 domain-containing protein [Candidatus Nanopelagicaceae bacterium]
MTDLGTDSARASFEKWRDWRAESLTGPVGNLALRETRWLAEADAISIEEAAKSEPPSVTVTSVAEVNPITGLAEQQLRFWDAEAEAIKNFKEITAFDYDPAWVITGIFEKAPEGRTIPFEHLRDNGLERQLVVPGDIHVSIQGKKYNLSAFDDDGTLLLAFSDHTKFSVDPTERTYGPGRFLFIDWAPGSDSNLGGEVILDFNRSFIPPCGFSEAYNCPLPPPQNRIDAEIRAGEIQMITSLPTDHSHRL